MLQLPILRWGQPYTSMDVDQVLHFQTGEPIARVSRANGGLIQRDMRKAQRARDVLRELSIADLIARVLLDDDQNAFGELVRRYQSPVRAFLTRMTRGDSHVAARLDAA